MKELCPATGNFGRVDDARAGFVNVRPDAAVAEEMMRRRFGAQVEKATVRLFLTATDVFDLFGPRCLDYEPDCGCCEAWIEWQRTGQVTIPVTRPEALKLLNGDN